MISGVMKHILRPYRDNPEARPEEFEKMVTLIRTWFEVIVDDIRKNSDDKVTSLSNVTSMTNFTQDQRCRSYADTQSVSLQFQATPAPSSGHGSSSTITSQSPEQATNGTGDEGCAIHLNRDLHEHVHLDFHDIEFDRGSKVTWCCQNLLVIEKDQLHMVVQCTTTKNYHTLESHD